MTDVSDSRASEIPESSYFLRSFLYITATLTLFFVIIISIIWYSLAQNEKRIVADNESYQLTLGADSIQQIFDDVINDVHMFADLTALCDYCTNTEKDKLLLFTGAFSEVGKYQYKYDQIRFIDCDGNELIRLNQNEGIFSTTPDSLLLNKSDRYYFQYGMQLEPGQIYVSPFDLNIDFDVIENKPVIRFVTPVIDQRDSLRGIVVLNYLGYLLKQDLNNLEIGTESHIQLLNNDGYWLHNQDHYVEWGFMFDERRDVSFSKRYPAEWAMINSSENGQFETSSGLFTFSHLYPLSSATHVQPHMLPQSDTYSWILISQVPYDELSGIVLAFLRPFIILAVFLEVFVIIGAALLSHAEARRKYALEMFRQAARTDPLTGLMNRRSFSERFEIEMVRYQRSKEPFSIILADIDRFKTLNDTFGHNTGDAILRTVADIFQQKLRKVDVVGRWGGEEFIFLLPETDGMQSATVAEKLRKTITHTVFPAIGQLQQVTVSFGVCEIENEQSLEELVKKADGALYRSKEAGRNTVTLHSSA